MFSQIARNWYAANRRAVTSVRYYLNYLARANTEPHNSCTTRYLECDTADLGQFVCRRLVPLLGTNPFPPNELMLMCAAMLWLRPALVVEWGTNIGKSARSGTRQMFVTGLAPMFTRSTCRIQSHTPSTPGPGEGCSCVGFRFICTRATGRSWRRT